MSWTCFSLPSYGTGRVCRPLDPLPFVRGVVPHYVFPHRSTLQWLRGAPCWNTTAQRLLTSTLAIFQPGLQSRRGRWNETFKHVFSVYTPWFSCLNGAEVTSLCLFLTIFLKNKTLLFNSTFSVYCQYCSVLLIVSNSDGTLLLLRWLWVIFSEFDFTVHREVTGRPICELVGKYIVESQIPDKRKRVETYWKMLSTSLLVSITLKFESFFSPGVVIARDWLLNMKRLQPGWKMMTHQWHWPRYTTSVHEFTDLVFDTVHSEVVKGVFIGNYNYTEKYNYNLFSQKNYFVL